MTIESPVCMPTGSKFSIEQTVSTFPAPSRRTSNSISFHPPMYFSMRTCVIGESMSPLWAIKRSSSSSFATPPPAPPSVYAGRTITGYPSLSAISRHSSTVYAMSEGTTGWSIFCIVSLKSSRSSALSMASRFTPMSSTPCSSKNPLFASLQPSVRPVCPPSDARMLSGFSFIIILLSVSSVSGSR